MPKLFLLYTLCHSQDIDLDACETGPLLIAHDAKRVLDEQVC